MIYLGADHRGFELKERIKLFLDQEGYEFEDLGNTIQDPDDDYPDFGAAVARRVAENPDEDRGILFCGSGVGMDIVANKFKGVRSALVWSDDESLVRRSREHDGVNVLSLPADFLTEEQAQRIIGLWLKTSGPAEERHQRRLTKVANIES
jgi:ribose 5-phosphate isomerase B